MAIKACEITLELLVDPNGVGLPDQLVEIVHQNHPFKTRNNITFYDNKKIIAQFDLDALTLTLVKGWKKAEYLPQFIETYCSTEHQYLQVAEGKTFVKKVEYLIKQRLILEGITEEIKR